MLKLCCNRQTDWRTDGSHKRYKR